MKIGVVAHLVSERRTMALDVTGLPSCLCSS
jgi:hypothetical protein